MKIDKNRNLVLLRNFSFPYKNRKNINKGHIALLSIGCNVGDCRLMFKKLILKIGYSKKIFINKISPLLINPAIGYLDQPDFLNFTMLIKTNYNAKRLLNYLQYLEERFKRVRAFKNSPRTLDIDIILFDSVEQKDDILQLPHPDWKSRIFVTLPTSKI